MSVRINSEAQRNAEVRAQRRRAMRRQVLLPIGVTLVLMALVPIGLLLLVSARQVGIVASFATVMILVPLVLVCLLPYALLLALIPLLARSHGTLANVFRAGRNVAHSLNMGSQRASRAISAPVIAVNRRLAWLERIGPRLPPPTG